MSCSTFRNDAVLEIGGYALPLRLAWDPETVNRRANGTHYRRAQGTPLRDGAGLIGHAPLRCARRREGGARPEARAAHSLFYSEVGGGEELPFMRRNILLQ